jgi:hypothetical protein
MASIRISNGYRGPLTTGFTAFTVFRAAVYENDPAECGRDGRCRFRELAGSKVAEAVKAVSLRLRSTTDSSGAVAAWAACVPPIAGGGRKWHVVAGVERHHGELGGLVAQPRLRARDIGRIELSLVDQALVGP